METDIRKFILLKLYRHRCWGGKHTDIENLQKGLPPHLRGEAKDIVKALIRENLIVSHPTSYGVQVTLNPRRKQDIEKEIM